MEATAEPRYNHTSHLHVRVAKDVLVDEHLRGPEVADVYSITKSVLATVFGVISARGLLPALGRPVADVLPELRGTPAEAHTWWHLLTLTRGAEAEGAWDVDELTALGGDVVAHVARAPQRRPPGQAFAYDNGSLHLLSAAAGALVGEPVSDFAQRELFQPLGVTDAAWLHDPDGVPYGYAHLKLRAADLANLGQLWLDGGRRGDQQLVDPEFLSQMTSAHSPGGPPEQLPYGFLIWVADRYLLAGGWAGQHVLVVPEASAVIVTTGDPRFDFGPPPRDELPDDWAPALDLVRRHLLPVLLP
jgi:CubicO group peptidase (beta-lactamase class C family)